MENILSDPSKFKSVTFDKVNDDVKCILSKEQEINKFLSELLTNGVITTEEHKQMSP